MPDITMCTGEACNKKNSCYRYTADSDIRGQSYFVTPPVKEDGTCDSYWKISKKVVDEKKD